MRKFKLTLHLKVSKRNIDLNCTWRSDDLHASHQMWGIHMEWCHFAVGRTRYELKLYGPVSEMACHNSLELNQWNQANVALRWKNAWKKTCARYLLSNRLIWCRRNSWIQIINEKFGGKNPIFNKILQSGVGVAAGSGIDRKKTNINRKQKRTQFF